MRGPSLSPRHGACVIEVTKPQQDLPRWSAPIFRLTDTVVGTTAFDAGLVIDTRGYSPLADLTLALQTDSAATNMQHMGVVKGFFIQP